jgi:hypothetical protein
MTNNNPEISTNTIAPIDTRTPRQIAGAANGRLAAGAKSPEGRARSAANASKHGLTAKKTKSEKSMRCAVTLLNESPAAFDDLCQSLALCFLPGDTHEMNLVYRMAQAEWLRQRAVHMETAALSEAMRQQAHPFQTHALHANSGAQDLAPTNAEALRAWHAFSKLSAANPAFATLQRYAATHARAYARAERELRDYRIAKAESIHPIPEPLVPAGTLQPAPANPSEEPQDRWLPLQNVPEPEQATLATPDALLETEICETPTSELENCETPTSEIENCETKVTAPLDPNNSDVNSDPNSDPNSDCKNNGQPHEPTT